MMRSEKDKMLAGELYDASAPDIQADLAATPRWLARYNAALDMPPPSGASYWWKASHPHRPEPRTKSQPWRTGNRRRDRCGSRPDRKHATARQRWVHLRGRRSGTARPAENASPGRAALGNLQRRWCDLVAACPIVPVSSEMMDER
jgi:hypothetical protein